MITTVQQCFKIQERRVAQGRRGYSKAVRRFILQHSKDDAEYKANLALLPVNWEAKAPTRIDKGITFLDESKGAVQDLSPASSLSPEE